MLLLNPPRDEESLRKFIEELRGRGARLVGRVLTEPYCDGEWCLLIISRQQARDVEAPCTWESPNGNCIIYATRQAVELLGLMHVSGELTYTRGEEAVPRVSVPGHRVRFLGSAVLSEVGFTQVSECVNRFGDLCTRRVSATVDAGENAVVVTVDNATPDGTVSSVVAKLPRRMAVVRDPYLGDEFLVAWGEDGRVIAISSGGDVEGFLQAIANRAGNRYWVRDLRNAKLIKVGFRVVEKPISAGLTEDGLIDPYGVLDTANYGVNWLINVFNWLGRYYGANQRVAWLNVAFTMAKLITPLVRRRDRQFIDFVIWNRGRGWEGKSTLVNLVLARMLQASEAPYLVVMSGPVTSMAQARTLIAINRLPLILDEQYETLAEYAQILHTAAVGYGVVSIHAPRYGLGEPVTFHNLRGVVVFTNVAFREFFNRVLLKAGGDRAILRRFIELAWVDEVLPREAVDDPPEVKPIYGLTLEVVRRHGSYLLNARNLIDLSMRLMDVLAGDYLAFKPIAMQTIEWLGDLAREKEAEVRGTAEELRLTDYARRYYGGQVNVFRELRALLEYGERDGEVAFSRGNGDDPGEVAAKVNDTLGRLFGQGVTLDGVLNGSVTLRLSDDALEAFRLIGARLNNGETRIIFKPRSLIIPGYPRSVLGVALNTYERNGVRFKGYSIRLDALLRYLLLGERPQA